MKRKTLAEAIVKVVIGNPTVRLSPIRIIGKIPTDTLR